MDGMQDILLTVEEAAENLKLSTATIRRLIRSQQISSMKAGARQYRIPSSALEEYKQRNMTIAPKPAASEVAQQLPKTGSGVGD